VFSHVNKKAIDQYTSFRDQKTRFTDRQAELDKGRDAIVALIDHLDEKKDEAIQRTFKGIARNFGEVFAEIVPGGRATLVIHKADSKEKDAAKLDVDIDETEADEKAVQKAEKKEKKHGKKDEKKQLEEKKQLPTGMYAGIGFKVSFGAGDHRPLSLLSGGQQTVLALALIFAIQRCDPSPFYLFDEIDANLDPVYRTAIARMITEQKKTTQFISTTFRPELLAAGDKFFGVRFDNRMSTVSELTPEEAQQLMQVVEKDYDENKTDAA